MGECLSFTCLSKKCFSLPHSTVCLVPLHLEDMELIRRWRNEQVQILRQQHQITKEEQLRYWKETLLPLAALKHPPQILFAIEDEGTFIGYCGLTNIDWSSSRCELSFLLDTAISEQGAEFRNVFSLCLQLLEYVAFKEMRLHRFVAEVFAFRKGVIAFLKSFGFSEEGRLRRHVVKGNKEFDSVLLAKRCLEESKRALLLTSISKKTALITSIRNAMGALGEHFCLIGCDKDAACLGQYSVDQFWHSPAWSERNAKEELLSFCKKKNVIGIIPTRDAELTFFSELKNDFAKEHIAVHCSSKSRIQVCQDKLQFMRFCTKNGITVIPSYASCESIPHSPFGYVVKERYSFTPKRLFFCSNIDEVRACLSGFVHPLIQPRIHGMEYSIDLYRSRYSKQSCALVRRRDIVVDTEAYLTTPVVHRPLERMALQAAEALNVTGHSLFQAIETEDKELYFIECNPRIGGASTAAFANGLDSVEWFILEEILKKRVHLPKEISGPLLPQVRIRSDVSLVL